MLVAPTCTENPSTCAGMPLVYALKGTPATLPGFFLHSEPHCLHLDLRLVVRLIDDEYWRIVALKSSSKCSQRLFDPLVANYR